MAENNNQITQEKQLVTINDEEQKTYVNCICCKLSLNIIYTIIYVTAAVFLNIVNRLVFYKYHFNKYNFTFMFLQQFFCIIFFLIVANKSKTFKNQAGEISFRDFKLLKCYYISFAIIFMTNTIIIFIGTQMIVNVSMFQTLRKLVLVKVYIYDLFYGYKKITCFTSICVLLVTIGSILSGIDSFSRDYLGIGLTMISNVVNVAYNKFTESFRRKTGVSNLKLLVYNSFISGTTLFVLIFATGEFIKVFNFFVEKKYISEDKVEGSLLGFILTISTSCTLVIILNSSFFMSNEKNSSMFTILLANTKDLLTCILSRYILAGNKFTFNIIAGLVISTIGSVMFSLKSICDNITSGDKKSKDKNEKSEFDKDKSLSQVVEIKSSRSTT